MPYLEKCQVIGEIGMDSLWCNVPAETTEGGSGETTPDCSGVEEAGSPSYEGPGTGDPGVN